MKLEKWPNFLILSVWLLVFFSSVSFAAENPSLQARRLAFLRKLESEGQLRVAGCKEVATAILVQNGLPPLGSNGQVDGIRASMERAGEDRELPVFTDGIDDEKNDISLRLQTLADESKGLWRLTIERTFGILRKDKVTGKSSDAEKLKTVSQFYFKLLRYQATNLCSLSAIAFSSKTQNAAYHETHNYSAEQCIDLVDGDVPLVSTPPNAMADLSRSIIRDDCKIGLHYFEGARKILLQDEKRKKWGLRH